MPKLSAADAAEKQVRNLKAAVPQIQAGVNRVTESPMEKAALQKDKMLTKLTESINNGKWERGLRRVSLQDWKNAFLTKGIPRIGTGAEAAKGKLTEFYNDFFPFLETVEKECAAMPNLNIDDAIAIATHNIRRIAEYKRA